MKPRHESTGATGSRENISARRSRPSVRSNQGIKVEETVTIARPAEELFSFWRNFENLPRIMEQVESVECQDERRSHWRVRQPGGGVIEWDAEIINEHPNELIAWRSLEGSDVRHAGSVRFRPVSGGTEVKLTIEYEAGGGRLVTAVAKLFRSAPEHQIREDLDQFKRIMESGRNSPASS
jgi:uncharacterized membrane protein